MLILIKFDYKNKSKLLNEKISYNNLIYVFYKFQLNEKIHYNNLIYLFYFYCVLISQIPYF